MVQIVGNAYRGQGLPGLADALDGAHVIDKPKPAEALFKRCPVADVTPLLRLDELAAELGVTSLHAKDERDRMGLGSFKALGAVHAIAKMAAAAGGEDLSSALEGETFVCASAGNHGLSVAAGARLFGARSVIYLSDTVPEPFADKLRAKGARVVRQGADYEASMAAAMAAADNQGWRLLSDSTWPGYTAPARDVMEGYLIMAEEVGRQLDAPPTHIFLQAGVGGLAAACTVAARRLWGDGPTICVVEPEFAPALQASIAAGKVVAAPGPVSTMGRLDCKVPSMLALDVLAREADAFMTVSEEDAGEAVALLQRFGLASSPSGVAGMAGLMVAQRLGDGGAGPENGLGIDEASRVLVYVSEAELDG
jgi:diaminopropionate ammonia-lyase